MQLFFDKLTVEISLASLSLLISVVLLQIVKNSNSSGYQYGQPLDGFGENQTIYQFCARN